MTTHILMVDDEQDAHELPGMSGIELLEHVRTAWPSVAVIVIAAYGDAATEAKSRERGADCFLTKPVDFGQLKLSQSLGSAP